jgi:rhamnogalacturonyl hydrolase YesR
MKIPHLCRQVVAMSILIAIGAASAQPKEQPATLPVYTPPSQYPIPYQIPKADEITKTLERIRVRLEKGMVIQIIDSRTKEPITDLSKSNPNAVMDRGERSNFGVITYPTGVINSGMLLCAEVTGDKQFSDFVVKQYQYFSDNYAKLEGWGVPDPPNNRRNPFWNFYKPDSLDACGAMGAAMVKARRMNVGPDMKTIIDRWANYVHKEQFRLDDGTLARNRPFPNALWGDDMYMSVPLLAQYGKLTGDKEYFDDAVKQVLQMSKVLFTPEKGLYAHAWHKGNAENHPRYYWGRANGWCMVAMVELLELLPEDHPGRADVIKQLQAHARGVAEVQSGSGLWHQMLDRDDSYLETSCTAMFSYAMAKGVNHGWLSPTSYASAAVAGWNGLTTHISDEGKLDSVCIGTSYADDAVYYYHRPAIDDIHGYGPVLLCGAEMIRLVKNDHLNATSGRNAPVMFQEKK